MRLGQTTLKQNWPMIALLAIHGLILLFLFRNGIYHDSHAMLQHDISVFFDYSSQIVHGAIPYRDFTVEYPPLAFIFLVLPRLAASTLSTFQLTFAVEIYVFDAIGMFILSRLSRDLKISPVATLLIYTALVLAVGPIIIYRFDLVPAVIVLASIYAFTRNKYKIAWMILAVAVLTKLYPAVVAPIFLIYQLSHRQYRKATWGIGVFAITTVIIVIPCLVLSASGFVDFFTMQVQRGLHSDTEYASLLLLGQTLGLIQVDIRLVGPMPLSVNVFSRLAGFLSRVALPVMIVSLAVLYFIFFRRSRDPLQTDDDRGDMSTMITFAFLAVLVLMLTNKVLSPQFIIWLFPLVPLVTRRWRHVPWLVFTAVCLLNFYLCANYFAFMRESLRMICVLLARNILLVILLGLTLEWRSTLIVMKNKAE
jgi:uncharacterized membrane protein